MWLQDRRTQEKQDHGQFALSARGDHCIHESIPCLDGTGGESNDSTRGEWMQLREGLTNHTNAPRTRPEFHPHHSSSSYLARIFQLFLFRFSPSIVSAFLSIFIDCTTTIGPRQNCTITCCQRYPAISTNERLFSVSSWHLRVLPGFLASVSNSIGRRSLEGQIWTWIEFGKYHT